MGKKTAPRHSPRRTQSVPSSSDIEACHRRWLALWWGTLERLEEEAPQAHELVHRALERHGFATKLDSWTRRDGAPTTELAWRILPHLTTMRPTPETMARVEAFAGDRKPIERRGRPAEAPLWQAVLLAPLLRQAYTRLPATDKTRETATQYVTRELSNLLGHREPASWLKLLRTARRKGLRVPWRGPVKPQDLTTLIQMFSATL